MDGVVRVTLEREPNLFLAGTIEGFLHQTVTARAENAGRLIGMGSRAVMMAFVNGRATPVGYLSQLRIDRTQRVRKRLIRGGYRKIKELHGDGAVQFYITTIVEDNRPARRFLEAGLAGLPRYRPLEPLVTLVIPVTRRLARGARDDLERGSRNHSSAVVDCLHRNGRRHQLARCWTAEDLDSPERTRDLGLEDFVLRMESGRVVGCLAVWDQTSFKQTVVRGYSPWLARLRPLVNIFGPWIRQPYLPPPGSVLKSAFASHLAVDDDDADTALALLRRACAEALSRGIDHLVLAFARRHPLLAPVKRAFPHREYVSVLYQVYWDEDLDRVPTLDDRIPHVEVATL